MMKQLFFAALLAVLAGCLSGCKKDEGNATLVFYTINGGHGELNIYVEGKYEGTITQAIAAAPGCGTGTSGRVLQVKLDPGSYRWAALGSDGSTFYATIALKAEDCHVQMIP